MNNAEHQKMAESVSNALDLNKKTYNWHVARNPEVIFGVCF